MSTKETRRLHIDKFWIVQQRRWLQDKMNHLSDKVFLEMFPAFEKIVCGPLVRMVQKPVMWEIRKTDAFYCMICNSHEPAQVAIVYFDKHRYVSGFTCSCHDTLDGTVEFSKYKDPVAKPTRKKKTL